jgi:glycosyltransferase involved in cell wall biosynthesis
MKLIVQIPCYNEAEILPQTIKAIPRQIPGISEIKILIIDDGSSDNTAIIAEENGVDKVVRLNRHVGLAGAFIAGLDASLSEGADIIVNTDADNQYRGEDIALLLEPILAKRADIVVGDRGVKTSPHFSSGKRLLQRFGSKVVQLASGLKTPDATSGFRALTRSAAIRTLVMSDYSYTLETLIQAGAQHWAVEFVPIGTNPQTRPSRLMKSVSQYISHSGATLLRAYTMYRPLRVFTILGGLIFSVGLIIGGRFLYFVIIGQSTGHVQSLILAAVMLIVGFQILLIGLLADLIGFNRRILEEALYRLRKLDLKDTESEAES